jgi:hypothetical protein
MLRLARAALPRLLPAGRPAFTDSAAPGSTCFLSNFSWTSWTVPDSGQQLIETVGEPTVRGRLVAEVRRHSFQRHGTDHDSKPLPSFPGFCLRARPLQCGQKGHRSSRATAKGFDRSLLTLQFAGARLQPTRRTALRVHSPVGGSRLSQFLPFAGRRCTRLQNVCLRILQPAMHRPSRER